MLDIVKLDNGLRIFLVNDNSKHTTYANLIVYVGGKDNKAYLDNKKIKIKGGVAHFLEHLVLECSKYGDLMNIFGSSGIDSNGLTSVDRTCFYIDTVNDLYKNLELLIKGIHSPVITDSNIETIKEPILAEKRRSLDNKYSNLYNASFSSLLNNKHFDSVLGSLEDIMSISSKDIISAFKTYYKPENEVIVIGGNFDKEKVVDIIKKSYESIEFSNTFIDRNIKENYSISKKKIIVKDDINIERSVISFKLDTYNYTPYDKLLLETYLYFFLKSNVGISSSLNNRLKEENIIVGNINYFSEIVEGYTIIRIEANVKDRNKFNKYILRYFKNKDFIFDELLFNMYQKNCILDLITRSDNIYRTIDPLIENIVSYNYEGIDTIDDLKKMSYDEYIKYISKLDFNNYNISMLLKN